MARDKPVDESGLLDISGVGQYKLDKYGNQFLDVIALYSVEKGDAVTANTDSILWIIFDPNS